jgi:hypothetical protein
VTDREFLLRVLADGEPHSQLEILQRSLDERGCGLTVHSRAADLRRHGYVVECSLVPGETRGRAFVYRLLTTPPVSLSADGVASRPREAGTTRDESATQPAGSASSVSASPGPEQQPLFPAAPSAPAWA